MPDPGSRYRTGFDPASSIVSIRKRNGFRVKPGMTKTLTYLILSIAARFLPADYRYTKPIQDFLDPGSHPAGAGLGRDDG